MSYLTLGEANTLLAHSAAWLALSDDVKKNHLITASLWLNFTYEWPGCIGSCETAPEGGYEGLPYSLPFTLGTEAALKVSKPQWPRVICGTDDPVMGRDCCPLIGVPYEVKSAQAFAALEGLTVPLFGSPSQASDGGLIKKVIKAGSVAIEKQWSSPTRGREGQLYISSVDAILDGIATRRGMKTGRMPAVF